MLKKNLNLFLLALSLFFCSVSAFADPVADLLRQKGDAVAGDANGQVTVVEFFDYQCSHCVNMATIIDTIKNANPNVRFVFKDFPIRGPLSHYAALAALAANKQNKYYELSHALLSKQPSTEAEVLEIAAKIPELNLSQLKKDMQSPQIKKQLASNITLARQLNLNGTPAFFIAKTNANTKAQISFYLGEMSSDELQSAIDKAKSQ